MASIRTDEASVQLTWCIVYAITSTLPGASQAVAVNLTMLACKLDTLLPEGESSKLT